MANPPLPRDVQDFQFKLVSKLKVYDRKEDTSGPVNLLAVSSKLGLVFIASPAHLQIFETAVLLENHVSKGVGLDVDTFPRYCVQLPSRPSHVAISCDDLHLAVVLAPKDGTHSPVALIYAVMSLISKNPVPAWEIQLGQVPGVAIQDISWNPRLPNLICACLCDGSVCVTELKGPSSVESVSLPATTGARCICWSPKGKQLVIGTAQGPFVRYKPDLKLVKVISPPPLPAGHAPISLLWLSSFQFAVVYGNSADNSSGSPRPGLYIVNAPKGETESHLNYDDICYSSGDARLPQYYLAHIPKWNVLLMSSANSMEVGVLGSDGSGGAAEALVWEQWTLEDASRAELPLSHSREEMCAVGMAVDTSPTAHLPWGENQTIPPAPLLLVLSNHGLLCSFNIINLRPGAAQDLCSPPEVIPGLRDILAPMAPPPPTTSLPPPPTGALHALAPPANSSFLQFSKAATVPSFASVPPPFGSQTGKAGVGWLSGGSLGFGSSPPVASPMSTSSMPASLPGAAPQVNSAAKLSAPHSADHQPAQHATVPISRQQPGGQLPSPLGPSAPDERVQRLSGDSVQPVRVHQPASSLPAHVSSVSDADILKAITQETALFEKELMQLKFRHHNFKVMIGTSEEKKLLRVKVDEMENFVRGLIESTQLHTRIEICALRTLLMEAFAWVEEARSRHLYSKNPRYLHLSMVQELDPVIKKHIVAVRNWIHYLDTQLQQLDCGLDNQWEAFQNTCSKKKRNPQPWGLVDGMLIEKKEIHMPSLEFVYQTILSQQHILEKHLARLDDLEVKVYNRVRWEANGNSFGSLDFQGRKRGPSTHLEGPGSGEQDLSRMAESLLALQLGEKSRVYEGRFERSANPLLPRKMPPRLAVQLCSVLAHKPMARVIPSPRGMSSLNVLPLPTKAEGEDLAGGSAGKLPHATSTPVKKEVLKSKVDSVALSDARAPVMALKDSSVSVVGLRTGTHHCLSAVSSMPSGEESQSTVLESSSKQSQNIDDISESIKSSSVVTSMSKPVVCETPAVTSVMSSVTAGKVVLAKAFPVTTASNLSLSSCGTTMSVSTQQAPQLHSIFSGTGSPLLSAKPSESNTWVFSTSGSFNIGSSTKPGGISSGKPVIPSVVATSSSPTPSITAAHSSSPAFSLNFSGNSKSSFSPTPKSEPQASFTLPVPMFGAKSGPVPPLKEEPLFVFGGGSAEAASEPPFTDLSGEVAKAKEDGEEEKMEEKPDEKVRSDPQGTKENMKQVMPEKAPANFSFSSAFGQPLVLPGKTSVADAPSVGTKTSARASEGPPPGEDVIPGKKSEGNEERRSEEKPAATRSLFTDFSFKLSEGDCESFGTKPLMFGAPGAVSPSSAASGTVPLAETSAANTPQPSVAVVPPETLSMCMPIISQPESSTTSPLSSLGTIVANLGSGSTFGKTSSEKSGGGSSSSFSSFSFSLPSKEESRQVGGELTPADCPKTIEGVSSPPTNPGTVPVGATPSSTPPDFGLANLLGQSSSMQQPAAQQPAQNPFASAGGGNVFGSGGSGSGSVNLFGQPALKQDSSSLFGSSPRATSPSPAFGSASVFGQVSPTSASVFGGSSFASKPSFGQSMSGGTAAAFSLGGSVFGAAPAVFGSPPATGSIFQATSPAASTFGSSSGGSFGSVAQAGFGSPPPPPPPTSNFQAKPGGFGGSPVFGAMAAPSGSNPSFGGAATFGSPPSFGSHVFGSSSASTPGPGSIFGSGGGVGTSSSSTFENLATAAASTLTFGNLAQSGAGGASSPFGSSQSQAPAAFGGSSSGGSGSSSFGGSSFTSWR